MTRYDLVRRWLLAGGALAIGCASPSPGHECDSAECTGRSDGEQDDAQVPASPCDGVLVDRSGRMNPDGTPIERVAGRLRDPLARLVYQDATSADDCPIAMDAIMRKLDAREADCSPEIRTRVVSETAPLSNTPQGSSYRTVTTRTCGDRKQFELLFAGFGIGPTDARVPGDVEIIAFERDLDSSGKELSSGVFNYYKADDDTGRMRFFGSSADFVQRGPGGPNLTSVRGCANCHTGGGLIMKELRAPWLHWEVSEIPQVARATPGAAELIANRESFMGLPSDGINLERTVVIPGNRAWNERRVQLLRDRESVAKLLEPLFCPVEVNISNARPGDDNTLFAPGILSSAGVGGLEPLGSVPTARSIATALEDYHAVRTAVGQHVPGTDQPDHVEQFGFIERAHADSHYVVALIEAGIIDRAFVTDVLMVDFTRPVLSDDRCDLLSFAARDSLAELPEVETLGAPTAIRRAFLQALRASPARGAPAELLLAHLEATDAGTGRDHATTVQTFVDACTARGEETLEFEGQSLDALVADLVKLRSRDRKTVFHESAITGGAVTDPLDALAGSAQHPFEVFEFHDTMTTDRIEPSVDADPRELLRVHPDARLSPIDCRLTARFVAPPLPP